MGATSQRWRLAALTLCAALLATIWAGSLPGQIGDRPLPSWRGPDVGPLRLVIFGTSLSHQQRWSHELAERLAVCLDRQVVLEVVARPGAGSGWALQQVDRVTALDPDVVLIEFSINDADILDGVWPGQSRDQHAAVLRALQAARPDMAVLLLRMNPVSGLLRHLQRPMLGRYYRQYDILAGRFDTGLADLTTRWRAQAGALEALPDGLHPDPDMAAQVIVPPVLDLLRDSYAGAPSGASCP